MRIRIDMGRPASVEVDTCVLRSVQEVETLLHAVRAAAFEVWERPKIERAALEEARRRLVSAIAARGTIKWKPIPGVRAWNVYEDRVEYFERGENDHSNP